jgi:hypothetical protein
MKFKIIGFLLMSLLILVGTASGQYFLDPSWGLIEGKFYMDKWFVFDYIEFPVQTNMSINNVTSNVFCLTGDDCITIWPSAGGGSGSSKWVDGGSYVYPNSSFADNVRVFGEVQAHSFNISIYNSSYEYWTNQSLTNTFNATYDAYTDTTFNASYEYWTNQSLTNTFNATYDAYTDTDTNASTACSGSEYLAGDGTCKTISVGGASFVPSEINFTASTYNASLINGSLTGYVAGNSICNIEFPGSHLCNEFEVTAFVSNMTTYHDATDAWIIGGSPKYIPADVPVNDCNGFTHDAAGTYLGNYWHFDDDTGGDGRALNCATTLYLACCSY